MRKVVAIFMSSMCAAWIRSRRHNAESNPSIADVATPAIEVPNANPSPLTGEASEARIAGKSVALSSANPVPLRVATMPRSVPNIPSNTSRPTRYGASDGPAKATRSPSMRRRAAWRTLIGN